MKEINLRDFYPWYKENVIIEVTEEVAEELLAGQRYIKASRRRVYRNKAHFSLDAEDCICDLPGVFCRFLRPGHARKNIFKNYQKGDV